MAQDNMVEMFRTGDEKGKKREQNYVEMKKKVTTVIQECDEKNKRGTMMPVSNMCGIEKIEHHVLKEGLHVYVGLDSDNKRSSFMIAEQELFEDRGGYSVCTAKSCIEYSEASKGFPLNMQGSILDENIAIATPNTRGELEKDALITGTDSKVTASDFNMIGKSLRSEYFGECKSKTGNINEFVDNGDLIGLVGDLEAKKPNSREQEQLDSLTSTLNMVDQVCRRVEKDNKSFLRSLLVKRKNQPEVFGSAPKR